ncbi:MAG: hypothetical protein OEX98_08385 [Nitrosopumilus sp.]|nr:hypothetical protein [Nitrosopumilus sp.]
MSFEKDVKLLQRTLLETEQRIRKLEEHKESVNKNPLDSRSDKTNNETLRRLERNLDNLYKKRILIMAM